MSVKQTHFVMEFNEEKLLLAPLLLLLLLLFIIIIIFEPKRDEVTGEWREVHNEKINELYSPPNTVRVIKSRRWAGHAARIGRTESYTGFWWGNLREWDHLENRHRWEDNIQKNLQEVGCGGMD